MAATGQKPMSVHTIPANAPFENDLLDRERSVQVLSQLIESADGPCVLAIDGGWGNGKTTFIRMWAQHLKDGSKPIIEFNAWATDFASDPFVALSQELITGITDLGGDATSQLVARLTNRANEVVKWLGPSLLRTIAGLIPVFGPQISEDLGRILDDFAETNLSSYEEEKKSLFDFKSTLEESARAISRKYNDSKLVIMIDELDRCRPTYAIELLEMAKHIFAVDRIVFVLAVNRQQLSESVKAIYGQGFEAREYLRRFIDIDFTLPNPSRNRYIQAVLADIRYQEQFESTTTRIGAGDSQFAGSMLEKFFGASGLSLREIEKALRRLGWVLTAMTGVERSFILVAVVLMILRTIDSELYARFTRGEARDLEVIEKTFNNPAFKAIREIHEGFIFERTIIAADLERQCLQLRSFAAADELDTPLLQRHGNITVGEIMESPGVEERAQELVQFGLEFKSKLHRSGPSGYECAVERIDFLVIDSPNY